MRVLARWLLGQLPEAALRAAGKTNNERRGHMNEALPIATRSTTIAAAVLARLVGPPGRVVRELERPVEQKMARRNGE
jgi:hypothetical protein